MSPASYRAAPPRVDLAAASAYATPRARTKPPNRPKAIVEEEPDGVGVTVGDVVLVGAGVGLVVLFVPPLAAAIFASAAAARFSASASAFWATP